MSESEAMENDRPKPVTASGSTRRRIIRRGITTVVAVSGTTAALAPILAVRRSGATATAAATGSEPDTAAAGAPADPTASTPTALFDEIYRGRRLQAFTSIMAASGVDLLIDGRPLHVMRRVDGSYISMANHYQPYTTVLATARGAVDVIGRAPLSAGTDAEDHHH
jgi:hypothetical protein